MKWWQALGTVNVAIVVGICVVLFVHGLTSATQESNGLGFVFLGIGIIVSGAWTTQLLDWRKQGVW